MKYLFTLILLCISFTISAQTDEQAVETIFKNSLTNGMSYQWLDHLSNQIGGRLSGSLNAERAVEYTKEELEKLVAVLRKWNITVLWDEIYGGINFCEKTFFSLPSLYPERTILTSGLSKLFSAGGYRLGYAIFPEQMTELVSAMHALISETYSCVNAPLQYATADLYRSDSMFEFIEHSRKIHKAAGDFLYENFTSIGLRCHRPEGAFYLFPDFSPFSDALKAKGLTTSRELGLHLINNFGVAMLPGEDFLHPGDAYAFRVATVDYDGSRALSMLERGESVDALENECFGNMAAGCEALGEFIKTL